MRGTHLLKNPTQAIPGSFFSRPSEDVAPDLIGCQLVKRQINGNYLVGTIVETEAYCQSEEACHGFKRRSPSNETLFGKPGRFYVYLTYGIHHCVNIVTGKEGCANGVLLRAIAMPNENERVASGPGLITRRFGINLSHDRLSVTGENNLWLAPWPYEQNIGKIMSTQRIGISKAKDLPWRWYLQKSRSVSRRAKGDSKPSSSKAWFPEIRQ